MRLRNSVIRFAEQMELVLRKNDFKGKTGWKNDSSGSMLKRISDELGELQRANLLHRTTPFDSIKKSDDRKKLCKKEAVDVANFCMMYCETV